MPRVRENTDQSLRLQAKDHGKAGKDHTVDAANAKKEGSKAEGEARKDAAQSEYNAQKAKH